MELQPAVPGLELLWRMTAELAEPLVVAKAPLDVRRANADLLDVYAVD
jgi:hypothetical protein